MSSSELFCPFCGEVAEERGKTRSLLAPPGWYRCPDCLNDTLGFKLPARKRVLSTLLAGQPPPGRVVFAGSLGSDTPSTTTLSLGDVSAQTGDQLIAQVVMKHPNASFTRTDPTVSWGAASVAMLGAGSNYGMTAGMGVDFCGCMRHTVLVGQKAPLSFTFSGTVADHRAIVAVRVSGLVTPLVEPFDDVEQEFGYPYDLVTGTFPNADFFVIAHAQSVTSTGQAATWENRLGVDGRIDTGTIVNTMLSTVVPVPSSNTFRATSGPSGGHGAGFFGFKIA